MAPAISHQNGVITGFTVVTRNFETSNVTQAYTTSTSIVVFSLQPFTIYEATVAASTALGLGPFSASITVQTEEAGNINFVYRLLFCQCGLVCIVQVYTYILYTPIS